MKTKFKAFMLMTMFAISASAMAATQVTISGGAKGGAYQAASYQLIDGMKRQGHKLEYMASKGSSENLERVLNGTATVGIAQLDDYASFIKENPQANSMIEIIGTVSRECAYVVSKDGGKVSSDQDLMKKGIKVAVGGKGSGSATTWDYMTSLEKGFLEADTVWKGGARTLGKVASGQVDAFMWVTNPNKLSHKLLTSALAANLKFVPVTDWDLNDSLPTTGESVYSFEKVVTQKGFIDSTYKTICTKAVIVANSEGDEELLEDLSSFALKYSKQLSKS